LSLRGKIFRTRTWRKKEGKRGGKEEKRRKAAAQRPEWGPKLETRPNLRGNVRFDRPQVAKALKTSPI
jgi:hypothetical protein